MKHKLVDAFVSANSEQLKQLRMYLVGQQKMSVQFALQNGNNVLRVFAPDYHNAITKGAQFVVDNNLTNIFWVTPANQTEKNLDDVAFYGNIDNKMFVDVFISNNPDQAQALIMFLTKQNIATKTEVFKHWSKKQCVAIKVLHEDYYKAVVKGCAFAVKNNFNAISWSTPGREERINIAKVAENALAKQTQQNAQM